MLPESLEILEFTIRDMVADFLYYDRKEDEDLPRGSIEEMITSGTVTVEDIVEVFRDELIKGIVV